MEDNEQRGPQEEALNDGSEQSKQKEAMERVQKEAAKEREDERGYQ